MLVLTDSETAAGFRLAGVEVREAEPETAQAALEDVIVSDAYGLVIVDESLIADPNSAGERAMRGRELPVLLSMPSLGAAFAEADDATEYMKQLVRSAIGFDVKLE
ncbi:MAG: V-type ATP synthase subunit F [Trueperaceae bacterium]|nr:MAG: V-type ATP synthase subunit F [Trueperaceae bacterium]